MRWKEYFEALLNGKNESKLEVVMAIVVTSLQVCLCMKYLSRRWTGH